MGFAPGVSGCQAWDESLPATVTGFGTGPGDRSEAGSGAGADSRAGTAAEFEPVGEWSGAGMMRLVFACVVVVAVFGVVDDGISWAAAAVGVFGVVSDGGLDGGFDAG